MMSDVIVIDDDGATATAKPTTTITTLTNHEGIPIDTSGRGRPRTTPIRFSAVTSDPFEYDNNRLLYFVIRGRPATKKRPGYGYQFQQRINISKGLETEFRDVVMKLLRFKDVTHFSFDQQLLKIRVNCCFPSKDKNRIVQVGDGNNLINFIQDSLQRYLFRDDGQFVDSRVVKKLCDEYGGDGYISVYITTYNIN